MQISNDDDPLSKSPSDRDSMDIDEEPQSDEEQVEVDVLAEAGSESEASEAAEGENEVEEPEEYELEDEDDEIQESRSPSVAAAPAKSPLKIKFKVRGGAVTRGRRTRATAVQVESSDSESEEEEMPQNVRLTKRQAALAKARKGIASSETSAEEDHDTPAVPNKKKRGAALDPSEVALRKEESARKRRNVSEKKLQNEKAETINRLLKKQSRPRNKRTTALSTATPVEIPTPVAPPSERGGSAPIVDVTEDRMLVDAENDGDAYAQAAALPTMYRWISTSRLPPTNSSSPTSADADADPEKPQPGAEGGALMSISFSVPASMIFAAQTAVPIPEKPRAQAPALCGVAGCGKDRRYRLVGGEWGAGACGIVHLKVLEGR
ncbi:hypothetical protein B0H19DRAFT_1175490 [Mycena capillaripes]|nr:hypothetical protein B0H19DRAFT_1175490 [Mycena capillaripes]